MAYLDVIDGYDKNHRPKVSQYSPEQEWLDRERKRREVVEKAHEKELEMRRKELELKEGLYWGPGYTGYGAKGITGHSGKPLQEEGAIAWEGYLSKMKEVENHGSDGMTLYETIHEKIGLSYRFAYFVEDKHEPVLAAKKRFGDKWLFELWKLLSVQKFKYINLDNTYFVTLFSDYCLIIYSEPIPPPPPVEEEPPLWDDNDFVTPNVK